MVANCIPSLLQTAALAQGCIYIDCPHADPSQQASSIPESHSWTSIMSVRLLTMTMVREESMVVETSVRAKSLDTRGTSDTARMPFISFMDACSSHANISRPSPPQKS